MAKNDDDTPRSTDQAVRHALQAMSEFFPTAEEAGQALQVVRTAMAVEPPSESPDRLTELAQRLAPHHKAVLQARAQMMPGTFILHGSSLAEISAAAEGLPERLSASSEEKPGPDAAAKLAAIRGLLSDLYTRVIADPGKPVRGGESFFRALLYTVDTGIAPTFDGNQVRFEDDAVAQDFDGYGERLHEQAQAHLQARGEEYADSLEDFDPHEH